MMVYGIVYFTIAMLSVLPFVGATVYFITETITEVSDYQVQIVELINTVSNQTGLDTLDITPVLPVSPIIDYVMVVSFAIIIIGIVFAIGIAEVVTRYLGLRESDYQTYRCCGKKVSEHEKRK